MRETAMFDQPYIDVDEWRDAPVRHRYVHGGFTATDTRFSIYFPEADHYQWRFFQHITPVPDSEHLAQFASGEEDKIGFSIASGAYFLETNGGGPSGTPGSSVDPTIAAYRANAAAAQYSRVIASEMYGEHRPFGYAYGGSGGGYRTIGGAENTTGVWDGFVPYVIGSPMSIPNVFTVRMHAQRLLRNVFDRIDDSVDAGGNRDMYAGLNVHEQGALREVTRMGFPPRSWFAHRTMGLHAFPVLFRGVAMADPSYFDEFWTEPGYLGHDKPDAVLPDVVHHDCFIVETIDEREAAELGIEIGHLPGQIRGGVDLAWRGAPGEETTPVAVRLSSPPGKEFLGAELIATSGAASDSRFIVTHIAGDVAGGDIAIFGPGDAATMRLLQPGDRVEMDNRRFIAAQTYHRHQVPSNDFAVWDQFRNDDGTPMYPQRPLILGPLFAAAAAGTVQTGKFAGKMIVVETLLDREALPWQADWYRARVHEHFGAAIDDHFRLWFIDHALHGDDEAQEHPARTVSYLGALHQALRDVSAWVELGVEPPASTNYEVVDGQIVVPTSADARRGVQPVVALTANGGNRAEVAVGEAISLVASIEVPSNTGTVVALEWDCDGAGTFPIREGADLIAGRTVERLHTFERSGTHFPTVRVVAQRHSDGSCFGRIQNIARVRVVVSERS